MTATLGALLLWTPLALGLTCNGKDDIVWIRFNAEDTVDIEITGSEDLGDPIAADLTSSGGVTLVGEVLVDPGSGPAGTDHQVWVEVFDDYEDTVQRVSIEVDSGERGLAEFELSQDSADKGFWWVQLRSVGAVGETRTDTFSVQLWRPESEIVTPDDTGDGA